MMTELQLNGGRKAKDAKETGWQIMLAFLLYLAASYLEVEIDTNALYGVLAFLVGRQGVHAWGNVKEHQAEAPTRKQP